MKKIDILFNILEILKSEGIDLRKIQIHKMVDGKKKDLLLGEIKQHNIDMEKIIKKHNLDPNYPIGNSISNLRMKCKGTSKSKIAPENKKKAEELGVLKRKGVNEELLDILEILESEGVNVRKIKLTKRVAGQAKPLLLSEISQPNIDINKIIKKYNLDPNYCIGMKLSNLRDSYKGNDTYVFSLEDRKRTDKLGIIEKKRSIEETLDILEILKSEGVDIRDIPTSTTVRGKAKTIYLKDINQRNVDIKKIIKKYNLDAKYPIGMKITALRSANNRMLVYTEADKKRAENLGILEKKTNIEKTLEILEILKDEGVDIRKIQLRKKREKEFINLSEISQHGIDMNSIIENNKLDGKYPIGTAIVIIRNAYNGTNNLVLTEDEKRKIDELGIAEKMNDIEEVIKVLEILKKEGVNVGKLRISKIIESGKAEFFNLAQISENQVDIKEIMEKYNLDPQYAIGRKISYLRGAYKGNNGRYLKEEEKRKAEALGVIKIRDMEKEKRRLEKNLEEAKKLKLEAEKQAMRKKNINH